MLLIGIHYLLAFGPNIDALNLLYPERCRDSLILAETNNQTAYVNCP